MQLNNVIYILLVCLQLCLRRHCIYTDLGYNRSSDPSPNSIDAKVYLYCNRTISGPTHAVGLPYTLHMHSAHNTFERL